jgi:hypothetical protein
VAAREQLGVVAELREQAERVGNILGRVIFEFARDHGSLLSKLRWPPTLSMRFRL